MCQLVRVTPTFSCLHPGLCYDSYPSFSSKIPLLFQGFYSCPSSVFSCRLCHGHRVERTSCHVRETGHVAFLRLVGGGMLTVNDILPCHYARYEAGLTVDR